MAKGLVNDELDTVEHDFGEPIGVVSARIKRRMSYGDRDDLTHAIVDWRIRKATIIRLAEQNDGKLKPDDVEDLELKTGKIALLRINVKEWNIEGPDGQPAPLNDESFRALEPAIAEWLLFQIDLRNPKVPPAPTSTTASTTS